MTIPKSETLIPRRPLLWLAAALLFTVPPMFGTLAPWVPVFFFAVLLAKFWMEKKGFRLRSFAWKAAAAAIGLGAVALTYGTLKGFEPGMSALLVLASLKILESYTARDFHILVMLGWFLCLCGFFNAQDLLTALYVFIAFSLLLTAIIQFHRGAASRGALWPPVRMAFNLLLQALPLVALMFFLFPRTSAGFRFYLMRPFSGQTGGLSDRLSPGSVAAIAASQEVAFRANFPDGTSPAALYWRGAVMWRGDGLNWQAGPPPGVQLGVQRASGEAIRQRITIEPHNDRWMFALDWPLKAPAGVILVPGNYLRSEYPMLSSRRYEVTSFREIRQMELQPAERRACLQVPATISPAVRDLAQSWTSQSTEPRAIIRAALQFFHKGGFVYSLSPGEYQENALDDFLFHRKIGFCEHYAASFATLMRVAGIPSRVVVGYQGGEFNDIGNYLVVRQSDAHAWCEVWLPGSGWQRVDPTAVVAPERVNLGFDSFLDLRETSGAQNPNAGRAGAAGMAGRNRLLNNVRFAWDTLNYTWDTRVLSFDSETQQTLFEQAGISDTAPSTLIIRLALICAGLVSIFALWMWLRTRAPRDPVKTLYERFCRRAARAGAKRNPWEGPADFSQRAAQMLPNEAERIRRLTSLYISLRYSPETSESFLKDFSDEVKAFAPRAGKT